MSKCIYIASADSIRKSLRQGSRSFYRFNRFAFVAIFTLVVAASYHAGIAQSKPVPVITGNERVDKLLSQMTLEEKVSMIHGEWEDPATNQGEAGYLKGIPRLGIPALRLVDGPPGVLTRLPSQAETATMGLAATFSKEDAEQNGIVIGREAKSLGADIVLQPLINMNRDITWMRAYNTFGEDPVLTGEIGAAEVRGIQGQGIMAQAKHWVAYDTARSDVVVDQRTLHEIYVAPFKDAVDAGVSSLMCAYSYLNGVRNCGNSDTLEQILRKELGFKGFVTSDWGASHAPTFVNDGLDMEMPGPLHGSKSPMASLPSMFSYFNYEKLTGPPPGLPDMGPMMEGMMVTMPEEPPVAMPGGDMMDAKDPRINLWDALHSGAVKEDAITRAAGRVLYEYDKFGFLDHAPQHEILPHETEANALIIQKTSEDAAVLLKNEAGVLPLKADDLASLAMIGPGAGQVVAIGSAGERSNGFPWRQVGPVEALKKSLPQGQTDGIRLAVANDMSGTPIPAEAFSHDGEPGLVRTAESGATQVDPDLNFTKSNGKALPANTRATWKGTLMVSTAGNYELNLQMLGLVAVLKIDGKRVSGVGVGTGNLHGDTLQANQHNLLPTPDGLDNLRKPIDLAAGEHSIEVSVGPDTSDAPAQIRLNWISETERQRNRDAAIAAAKDSKTAVVFAWSRGNPDFALPGDQDKLIEEIAAVNSNTIVVLNVSQPIAMPWLDKVKAVLLMWYTGDEGGWSTANLLLGKTSPAGRLPFTWAKKLEDYCCANNPAYPERTGKGVNGKTTYSEGIFIGYRWFDKEKTDPLYPFGYGLSYTKFAYSDLKAKQTADGGLDVDFKVKNIGLIASDEVPQVYLGAPANPPGGTDFAVHALAGFSRIHLEPKEQKTMTIHLMPRRLQYWATAANAWVIATGSRHVLVGGSSRDLPLETNVNIQ